MFYTHIPSSSCVFVCWSKHKNSSFFLSIYLCGFPALTVRLCIRLHVNYCTVTQTQRFCFGKNRPSSPLCCLRNPVYMIFQPLLIAQNEKSSLKIVWGKHLFEGFKHNLTRTYLFYIIYVLFIRDHFMAVIVSRWSVLDRTLLVSGQHRTQKAKQLMSGHLYLPTTYSFFKKEGKQFFCMMFHYFWFACILLLLLQCGFTENCLHRGSVFFMYSYCWSSTFRFRSSAILRSCSTTTFMWGSSPSSGLPPRSTGLTCMVGFSVPIRSMTYLHRETPQPEEEITGWLSL